LHVEQTAIEAAVPKTTYSPREALSSTTRNVTQTLAAELRHLLDQLDDLRIARMQIVEQAKRTAAIDDIKPRILRHAADAVKEQWADVDPASFADVIDTELAKYDTFQDDLKGTKKKQEDLLSRVEVISDLHDDHSSDIYRGMQEQNRKFLESRKADPSIKDREATLTELDLAYQEYRDITRHLEEGLKVVTTSTPAETACLRKP
jgi:programmed cell death 6-interacting protein